MTVLIAKFRFYQINPWEEKYACWTTYLDFRLTVHEADLDLRIADDDKRDEE